MGPSRRPTGWPQAESVRDRSIPVARGQTGRCNTLALVSTSPAVPGWLTIEAQALSSIAQSHGLRLVGADRSIVSFGSLTSKNPNAPATLTYATSPEYLGAFLDSDIGACVTTAALIADAPANRSLLLTPADPATAFYIIFEAAVATAVWTSLPAYRGTNTHIASTARIHDSVVIGDECQVMDNAVILPQTYLGSRVVIKPHATIGGEGFQLRRVGGTYRRVPHAGGVLVGDDVTIGAQTCIDRGLFGDFTTIGDRTHIDNLVHIAHSARVGNDAVIVACAEISGSVTVGDGAWLAPACAINPGLTIGAHSLIGTGSTVTANIPRHGIAYGSPARVRAWRCTCGTRLADGLQIATCSNCGKRFGLGSNGPRELGERA